MAIFQAAENKEDKGRARLVMAVVGLIVALVGAGVIYLSTIWGPDPGDLPAPQAGLPGASHAGEPVFEKYHTLVQLADKKYFTAANLLGQTQAMARGKILNMSDKTVTGVELRGKVIGKQDKVLATALAAPVPRKIPSIPPKGTVEFNVTIDGIPRGEEIMDITVEIEGLMVQE